MVESGLEEGKVEGFTTPGRERLDTIAGSEG